MGGRLPAAEQAGTHVCRQWWCWQAWAGPAGGRAWVMRHESWGMSHEACSCMALLTSSGHAIGRRGAVGTQFTRQSMRTTLAHRLNDDFLKVPLHCKQCYVKSTKFCCLYVTKSCDSTTILWNHILSNVTATKFGGFDRPFFTVYYNQRA